MITLLALCLAAFGAMSWLTLLLLTPALFLLDVATTELQYLAVMTLQRARDNGTLPPEAHAAAIRYMPFAYACDFFTNIIWGTVLFWAPPREALFTARLERYVYGTGATPPATGWRLSLALWIARVMLDWADPRGKHIRP